MFLKKIQFVICILLFTSSLQAHESDSLYIILPYPQEPFSENTSIISKEKLELLPARRVGDLLESSPGLVAIQHSGGGKANQYYLRGFDADHGTDISVNADGVPINMPSHGHGQGYADLNFIIPELISEIEVRKGPFDARDGDFATSGSFNLKLKEKINETQLKFEAGSFNYFRGLALVGKQNEKNGFYLANEIGTNDGPFENPDQLAKYNMVGRGYWQNEKTKALLTLSSYNAFWNASNQLPLSLTDSGALSRFDALDASDGGNTHRHQIQFNLSHQRNEYEQLKLLAYLTKYDLDLYSNFTFFLNDSVNGDQIHQQDHRLLGGYKVEYERQDTWKNIKFNTLLGTGLRADTSELGLFNTQNRERVSSVSRSNIALVNPNIYWMEELAPLSWMKISWGLRGDMLFQNVEDLLGTGNEGSRSSFIFSPKVGITFNPVSNWDLTFKFGQGFHSNDARGVMNLLNPADPFAKATGLELGNRLRFSDKFEWAFSLWSLRLGSELVYIGDEGATEAKGRTRRLGFETNMHWHLLPWLKWDADFAYAHARFLDLPSGENYIPLAPRWTASTGLSAKHSSGFFGSLRLRAISDRPANEDQSLTASGYQLVDMMLGYEKKNQKWFWTEKGGYTFTLQFLNLLNQKYRESQFDTTSRPDSSGAEVRDIHFTPGYPLTVMGSFSLNF